MRDKRLLSQLSKADLLQLLEIINDLQYADSDAVLKSLMLRATAVAGCEYSTSCVRQLDTNGVFQASIKSVDGNFPSDWLQFNNEQANQIIQMLRMEQANLRRTLIWSQVFSRIGAQLDKQVMDMAKDIGLRDGVTLMTLSNTQSIASLFSFSGAVIDNPIRSALVLTHLAPLLHSAIIRLASTPLFNESGLTERERETLRWIQQGKTNWEISQIIGIKERTVKFHVQNIFTKLKATSRSHAVALASSSPLIEP